ncbi:nuclease SbcCD subunit C [Anaerocolumna cellulosilytica]|uniref:Nuclease SbcCD subunit C n=1 Tax=Anaerocolumna cellulosilytica TaxID=433286 RepID=A0A6S6R475_9FIRM|nr:SMC family ATPase [Anaerocolumna cellulosilytica]MBB5194765.1 exonuclease SbcC [Anaerocolumna cellulosilytica]BCJ94272.1 nuclease SbcCD subunit C [Anaerocolumna cellulosilytica]
MRPIYLIMNAFGPYGSKIEVNFEVLKGQGLFLITGDTGAGKTTIFDAIAFALFGEASGSIRGADTFRSDFAEGTSKTFVEYTFEQKGKRYVINRNPRYIRPKKNGEGNTTENAEAVLTLPNGEVITGYKEVSNQVVDLLGITSKQFKQIAMIAQGEFLQLLLADSKERGEVFRRVFNTELYQNVQRTLKNKELEAKKSCENSERSILQYISGIHCPPGDVGDELKEKIATATIHSALDILDELQKLILEDAKEEKSLKSRLEELNLRIEEQVNLILRGKSINKIFSDLTTVNQKLEELLKDSKSMEFKETQVKAAETARHQVMFLEENAKKEKESENKIRLAIEQRKEEVERLTEEYKKVSAEYKKQLDKEPEREQLLHVINRLQSQLPQYRMVSEQKQNISKLSEEIKLLTEKFSNLQKQKEEHEKRKKVLKEELEGLKDTEVLLIAKQQERDNLEYREQGLKQVYAREKESVRLKEHSMEMVNRYKELETEYTGLSADYLHKETAFFREQAGIIAKNLTEGEACPVCGSTIHPHKAVLSHDAPSETLLISSKKEVEKKRSMLHKAGEEIAVNQKEQDKNEEVLREKWAEYLPNQVFVNEHTKRVNSIIEAFTSCKKCKEETEAACQELSQKKERKTACLELLEASERALQDASTLEAVVEKKRTHLVTELAAMEGAYENTKKDLEYTEEEARQKLNTWDKELACLKNALKDMEDTYHKLGQELKTKEALLENQNTEKDELVKRKEEALKLYQEKRIACGFLTEEDYQNAKIPEDEIKSLKESIDRYQDVLRTVRQESQRLTKETAGLNLQDIAKLEEKKVELEDEKKKINGAIEVVTTRLGMNVSVAEHLKKAVNAVETLQKEYLLLSRLSKTANGELAGKQKIAFEQYVQTFYFKQILSEANKRLKIMTNNRFELFCREEGMDLRSQSGLEIDVLDHYTGKQRPVKSLSGGEAFKASLSMALGLSDVIQRYAGGVEMNTLFIDEGFGALDSESLEQAIQTLQSLADKNRLVGIISHVTELKERIDRQIKIEKNSMGSIIQMQV